MTIDLFFEYNFSPIIGLIFQIVILAFGNSFTKKEKYIFALTILLEISELLAYNLEYYFASLPEPTFWRTFFSIWGYIERPSLVIPFVVLLRPDNNSVFRKIKYWDLIPLALVIIIEQFAYGTQLVFWFSSSNSFHRGPLGYISQIVTIIYMVEASIEIIVSKFSNKKNNISLIIIIMLYVVLAMIFESVFNIHSLGISSAVFSIVFFMFAIQSSHLKEASDKLKTLSETDSLSKLSNRYYGEKLITDIIESKTPGMFALMDIDKFKRINDTYGHDVGDEVIRKVAQTLRNVLMSDDIIMRLGGDEFAVYSTHVSSFEDAETHAEKLFGKLHDVQISADKDYHIELSVGLAKFDGTEDTTFDKLYKAADTKLYEAKKFDGCHICH